MLRECAHRRRRARSSRSATSRTRASARSRVIGPYARLRPGTELADEVHIGNFVEVKNSHDRRAAQGQSSRLHRRRRRSARDVNIGAGTITCNYDGANKHRTVIEDDVFIGSDTPAGGAGDASARGATIGAGTTMTKDAPPGELTVARARADDRRGLEAAGQRTRIGSKRPCAASSARSRTRNIVPVLVEGLQRLEYRGYDSCGVAVHRRRPASARAAPARVAELRTPGRSASSCRRHHRHRPHALGHARRAGRAQRASALLAASEHRAGAQRHHREPRGAARRAARRRATSSQPDRHRSHRAPDRPPVRRRPARGGAARASPQLHGAYAIAVFCRDEPQRVVGARAGCAAGAGRRRRRELPRLRRDGAGRRDRPDRLPRRGRRGRPAAATAYCDRRRATASRSTRAVHDRAGVTAARPSSGPYRHYMQKEIFEQPRAIADTLEGVAAASRPSCSATAPYRVFKRGRLGADPRLRHQLLQRAAPPSTGSKAIARHPDAGRDRQRIPLPRQRAAIRRTLVVTISPVAAKPPTRWPR